MYRIEFQVWSWPGEVAPRAAPDQPRSSPVHRNGAISRLIYKLIIELGLRGKRFGVASACIGGGQGMAVLIERA